MSPKFRRNLVLGIVAAVAALVVAGAGLGLSAKRAANVPADFVGRDSCIQCHQQQYDLWKGSHHDLAMEHATDTSVVGDFSGATFIQHGVTSTFFKRDGKFFVNTEGPDAKLHDYEVKYTFGITPLQQYLIEFPGGRLQSLTIAWDDLAKRWYSLYPEGDRIEPHDPLHWTNRMQNWNFMCAQCHSTNLRKNYDPVSDTYNTTWSEMDVSCEACHGPGSRHVAWAGAGSLQRYFTPGNYGLITKLKDLSPDSQLNSCFLCHARREVISDDYLHGEPWQDHFNLSLLHEGLYHADGQILDEVYEYASFTQSKMYHMNVRCSDCHDPHSLKLRAPGNALCIRCHLPGKYDVPAHHHHQPALSGSFCVDCHMPTKTYMGIDVRRDHSLRLPRPDLTVKLGAPNACNQCHADKPAQWAADAVVQWFGPTRPYDPHYGEIIAPARQGRPEAMGPLISLVTNPATPAVVRATGVFLLRNYATDQAAAQAIVQATKDASPMVRAAAVGGLQLAPPQRVEFAGPLLSDPYRSVRIEAARVLAPIPPQELTAGMRETFEAALDEWVDAQMVNADMPGAWMNLGLLKQAMNQPQEAIANYNTALKRDPTFIPARMNLAVLYNVMGRNDEAEKMLREVIRLQPQYGESYYSLGLLLSEDPRRLPEAAEQLKRATELMPQHTRAFYNYGLAAQHLGQIQEAERALARAYELEPRSPDFVNALVSHYAQRRMWPQALTYARYLAQLVRQNEAVYEDARRMIAQLEAAMRAAPE